MSDSKNHHLRSQRPSKKARKRISQLERALNPATPPTERTAPTQPDRTPPSPKRESSRQGPSQKRATRPQPRTSSPRSPKTRSPKTRNAPGRWWERTGPRTWWRLGWVVSTLGVVVGVGAGAPVLGRSWNWVWVAVGTGTLFSGLSLIFEARSRQGSLGALGWRLPAAVGAFTLIAILGLLTTPVVGGRPVLSDSEEAQLATFATTMVSRLYEIGELDTILGLDQIQGRLRIPDLEEYYVKVEGWSREYDRLSPSALAVEDLAEPHLLMSQTLDQVLAATDAQLRWLKAGDPVARRAAQEHRQAMATGVLRTGQLIADVARRYGVPIGDYEGGLVE